MGTHRRQKACVEDVFGALKHEASRNNNCKVSRAHALFEATLCKALHPKPTNMDDKDKDPPETLTLLPADWRSPLVVPVASMGEGMFITPNSHKPEHIDLQPLKENVARAAIPWRPAGPAALQRMAASSEYLLLEADRDWVDIRKAWAGVVLSKFGVFTRLCDNSVFVSLGFCKWVALVLPLTGTR